MPIVAELHGASKVYQSGDTLITALDRTDLQVRSGKLLLIIGPSGSGKTTLLSLLGCVIYPSTGSVVVQGQDTSRLDARQLAQLRSRTIGFVFQSFNLITPLSAEDNVMFPLSLIGVHGREARERAHHALETVGMLDRRKHLPRQLSGGQQQRVAIARALVTDPPILLCDEPTASLDKASFEKVLEELRMMAELQKAVVVVTHDHRLEPYADELITVENGKVSYQSNP